MEPLMRRIAFVVFVSTLAGAAHAGTIYKCVSRAGVSYQQAPCPASTRTARTIEATPEPSPTAADLAEREKKAQRDRAESAYLSHLAGTDQRAAYRGTARRRGDADQGQAACRSAEANRDRTLQRVGLKRTFDLLRKLDEQVAQACRRR
jgi:hypothetical protein